MARTSSLSVIAFDADDTLWQNETFFRMTEEKFTDFLKDYAAGDHITERLLAAERRNLEFYGYGVKGFTLSMIETAIEVTQDKVPATVLHDILRTGRDMLRHPIETLPYVTETLNELSSSFQLVMITKGDLFDQERKLAQSGLGELFETVEIVSEKKPEVYRRIFRQHSNVPHNCMMVGNSLKSDVIPALAAGSWGVHVPHDLTWALEHAAAPVTDPKFHEITDLGKLPDLIYQL
ncbi:MAG: HAD family hydrolase [Sneathiella sp.]|uniref:HAD family hydrolase n=1 Tax=Sneathiella sp. TaxID=1964365 RepID=UPI0030034561